MMDAETENQQRYDYIDALMQRARKGRVIEKTERVEFKKPEAPDNAAWREQAVSELRKWLKSSRDKARSVELWAASYIKCGACYRDFQLWVKSNPVTIIGWFPLAVEIITNKRWI